MQLVEVTSTPLAREFLQLPVRLYKGDPNYIRPLDEDVENVFDPQKNKFFQKGICKRWLLREKSTTIGRIAAFVNGETARTFDQPTGGIGFFESINDASAAFKLFDAAKEWLLQQGMEAMDGPINFGDRDRWWGLLVDGFYPPCYCSNYNPPYYRRLFEEYGFELYFKQFTYYRKVQEKLDPRLLALADRVFSDPAYSFRHIHKAELQKFVRDFRTVYNKAWVRHHGVAEMTEAQARQIVDKLRPVVDERLAWFAYHNTEPIGFFLSLPELNQLFVREASGQLDLVAKMRMLFRKWTRRCRTMYGIAFGVVPEFQRRGIEMAMIASAAKYFQGDPDFQYQELQMNWIGDFNPKMMHVAERIGGSIYKTHHTYRYLFDRTKDFQRHPIL